jgi:hypothetical protein
VFYELELILTLKGAWEQVGEEAGSGGVRTVWRLSLASAGQPG